MWSVTRTLDGLGRRQRSDTRREDTPGEADQTADRQERWVLTQYKNKGKKKTTTHDLKQLNHHY